MFLAGSAGECVFEVEWVFEVVVFGDFFLARVRDRLPTFGCARIFLESFGFFFESFGFIHLVVDMNSRPFRS